MTKPTIRIHNIETDEVTDREMTAAEYADHLARIESLNIEIAEAEAKATDKASALAKLAALGLSADEIAAL